MEITKLKMSTNEVEDFTKDGKMVNNGRKAEVVVRFQFMGNADVKLDNVSYINDGDVELNGIKYQIKSNRSEIKLLAGEELQASKEEIIKRYITTNKASRYIYVANLRGDSYMIDMDTKEFEEFANKFYKLEKNNKLRINIVDKSVIGWACCQ